MGICQSRSNVAPEEQPPGPSTLNSAETKETQPNNKEEKWAVPVATPTGDATASCLRVPLASQTSPPAASAPASSRLSHADAHGSHSERRAERRNNAVADASAVESEVVAVTPVIPLSCPPLDDTDDHSQRRSSRS